MTKKIYTLLLVAFLGLSTHAVASIEVTATPVTSQHAQQTELTQQSSKTPAAKGKKAFLVKKAIKRLLFSEPDESERFDGLAVAGFVCGVVGLLTLWLGIGILLGILAIIFSAVALSRMKRTGKRGRGLAIAGLVLGILTIALLVLAVAALLFVG